MAVDAADAEDGNTGGGGGFADGIEADWGVVGFGGCCEEGAESNVVGHFGHRGGYLLDAVGGFADEKASGESFGFPDGHVVLADVDGISAGLGCKLGVVVDYEGNPGIFAEFGEFFGERKQRGWLIIFCPELEDIGAAGEELASDGWGAFVVDVAEVEDGVKEAMVPDLHRE